MTDAGGTLGGPAGFTLGGSYQNADGGETATGATLGAHVDLARRVDMVGRARIRIELSGGVQR
jgi:hypothetical protein